VILAAGYGAYTYLPVLTTRSSIAHAVERQLPDMSERLTDAQIRTQLVRSAKVVDVDLDPNRITFDVQRRPGEREWTVDVEYPMTIVVLGEPREIVNHVHVSHVVPVDEAAEARLEAQLKQHADRVEHLGSVNRRIKAKRDAMIADCEHKTGGPCQVQGSPGGYFGMAPDDEDDVEYVPAY
jgi:hypothetical protein